MTTNGRLDITIIIKTGGYQVVGHGCAGDEQTEPDRALLSWWSVYQAKQKAKRPVARLAEVGK